MELVYKGKTKDVYARADGNYLLKFKDDVTGENGVFDPGANTVGLTMTGSGAAALQLTKHFFELLADKGIPTHYLTADLPTGTMTVKPAAPFGHGLEVICRYRATGSFLRRYGLYATEGQPLDAFVEMTLKDDARQDPPINKDALVMLDILTPEEYRTLKRLTKEIGAVVQAELARKGAELYDIKFEFGKVDGDRIVLIDEISGGNMRAYKDGKPLDPLTLTALVCGR